VDAQQITSQAFALKQTAEVMVNAGNTGAVDPVTRNATEALLEAVKKWRSDNPVIMAMKVQPSITWPEVLTIANAIYTL
jgi:hypothetical protein